MYLFFSACKACFLWFHWFTKSMFADTCCSVLMYCVIHARCIRIMQEKDDWKYYVLVPEETSSDLGNHV